jgi:hypothetical protein
MSKFISFGFVGVLAFSLTSCGSPQPSPQEQAMEIVRVACIEAEEAKARERLGEGNAAYWAVMRPALTKAAKLDSSYVPVLEASWRTNNMGLFANDDLVKVHAACEIARS